MRLFRSFSAPYCRFLFLLIPAWENVGEKGNYGVFGRQGKEKRAHVSCSGPLYIQSLRYTVDSQ
jgi:hypothetical protein